MSVEFNLEEWQRLAREDPEGFERKRAETIQALIDGAPAHHRDRLRGLQFRIDLERKRAKTPLGATIRLQSMMWERFEELRAALLAFSGGTAVPEEPVVQATVLPFRKRD